MSKQVAKNQKQTRPPTQPNPISNAAAAIAVQQVKTEFSAGPLPTPAILEGYNKILPGAAERIMVMAENEAAHRQAVDMQALQSDIGAQKEQLVIANRQLSISRNSDILGQVLGGVISLAAIAGCIFLAIHGHTAAAIALIGLPIAAIINALRSRSKN